MMIDRKKLKRMAIEMFSRDGREYGSIRMQFVFKIIDVVWYGCQINDVAKSRDKFPFSHMEYKFCALTEEAFLLRQCLRCEIANDDVFVDVVEMFLRMNVDFSSLCKRVMYFYGRALTVPTWNCDRIHYFKNENARQMDLERVMKRLGKSGKNLNQYEFR